MILQVAILKSRYSQNLVIDDTYRGWLFVKLLERKVCCIGYTSHLQLVLRNPFAPPKISIISLMRVRVNLDSSFILCAFHRDHRIFYSILSHVRWVLSWCRSGRRIGTYHVLDFALAGSEVGSSHLFGLKLLLLLDELLSLVFDRFSLFLHH